MQKLEEKTQTPINNIFWVPVEEIYFLECSGGGSIQGCRNIKYLSEADTPGEARIALRRELGFVDNYNDLPPEKRKNLVPFRFRDGKIEKVLPCDKRYKSSLGDYCCGIPVDINYDLDGESGEFGMCCLEGFDVPEEIDCPYKS